MRGARAPIDLLSGRADATAEVHASGYSPSAILATLSGHGTLTVYDGAVSGFDLFRLKLSLERAGPEVGRRRRRAMSCVRGRPDSIGWNSARAWRMAIWCSNSGELTGIAGAAHISGGMNLASRALDATIALRPSLPSPPEVAIHLTGSIDRPVVTPELAGLARWMAELVR